METKDTAACCSICRLSEGQVIKFMTCESCHRVVCNECCCYLSPIPFMGKCRRRRICRRCVLCFSNCDKAYSKNFVYTPEPMPYAQLSYSSFAESKCCKDLYSHSLLTSERKDNPSQSHKVIGEFRMTPLWVPDALRTTCKSCGKPFSMFVRKHHCRLCGNIFCKSCCSLKADLSEYGYPANRYNYQRVCSECYDYLKQVKKKQSVWESLPFSALVTVCTYLSIPSMFTLSLVDKDTHRKMTSRDFDQTYWHYVYDRASNIKLPLRIYFEQNERDQNKKEMQTKTPETPSDDIHLSVQIKSGKKDIETSIMYCTEGCHWRLMYVENIGIPKDIGCTMYFLSYPIISLRIASLRQIQNLSTQKSEKIMEEVQKEDVMTMFIKCLQFSNNEIKKSKSVSNEIKQLLVMCAGCLMNVTQSRQSVCALFREKEGITTIIALLQNEYLNGKVGLESLTSHHSNKDKSSNISTTPLLSAHSSLRTKVSSSSPTLHSQHSSKSLKSITPMDSSSHLMSQCKTPVLRNQPPKGNSNHQSKSLRNSLNTSSIQSTPTLGLTTPSVQLSSYHLLETSNKKIVSYLCGILMNISKLDALSCQEISQLGGIEILINMIQLSQEKQIIYCLECIRACCRNDDLCKTRVGANQGIIKIINSFLSTSTQVIVSAVNTASVVLSHHNENMRLFCLANGLETLLQIEETMNEKCCISTAKVISNLLCNPIVVTDFLQKHGLSRLTKLMKRKNYELNGYLLGHLMNCVIYAPKQIYIQAPLLSSMIDIIKQFIYIATHHRLTPSPHHSHDSPISDHSPTQDTTYLRPQSISFSQQGWHRKNMSDETNKPRSNTMVDELDKSYSTAFYQNLSTFVGYGAGAIRHIVKNEENCQLCLDFNIQSILEEMDRFCDSQGRLFIKEAQAEIKRKIDSKKCVQRSPYNSCKINPALDVRSEVIMDGNPELSPSPVYPFV